MRRQLRLELSHPPSYRREDFVVSVWRGSPAGVYSDDADDDDEDEDAFRMN